MSSPTIFVSCGQSTKAERQLGKDIKELVKRVTGHDAFFAQEVQDLGGLRDIVFENLRNCAGFIVVMHPRGEIPAGGQRASVWIEQEIAIATYIQHIEKKEIRVIAFAHHSIGLEGLRSLSIMNPMPFIDEQEILDALPSRLDPWRRFKTTSGIRIELNSISVPPKDSHQRFLAQLFLVNESNRPIEHYDFVLSFPERILKHQPLEKWGWVLSDDLSRFLLELDDKGSCRTIFPRTRKQLVHVEYCVTCGLADANIRSGGFPNTLFNDTIEASLWIDGEEYSIRKTLIELHTLATTDLVSDGYASSLPTRRLPVAVDFASKWKELAADFAKADRSIRADWAKMAAGESWRIAGGASGQVQALCHLTGSMLTKSPSLINNLDQSVVSQTDNVDRWLYHLKAIGRMRYESDKMFEVSTSGGDIPVLMGFIYNLGQVSSEVCILCAASEM